MKTFGQLFSESEAYKGYVAGQGPTAVLKNMSVIELKAVFRTGAGFEPENIRTGRIELDPQRPIAVIDMVTMLPINSDAVRYMEETTFTNNAVETAESTATTASDLVGEAALAFTERTIPVEWLPGNIRGATVRLQGRNLLKITDFQGLDPEVSEDGVDSLYRQGYYHIPPFRTFILNFKIDF